MQANGAEILRLACCYLVEAGIRVCAPVHDAVLIEVPIKETEEQVSRAQQLMARASRDVLSGFELGTDVEIFKYPESYSDGESGQAFWEIVTAELGGLGNNSNRKIAKQDPQYYAATFASLQTRSNSSSFILKD